MNNYEEIIQKQLVIYNLPSHDSLLNNLKENNIVNITYITIINPNIKEDINVLIKKIDNNQILGVITNVLITNELEIGDDIIFYTKHIKDYSDKLYSLNNEFIFKKRIENNPITKYFSSIQLKFI
jgi:hypothetical protein